MPKSIFIILLISLPSIAISEDRFSVHALGQKFSVPTNCKFYARPAITAGEIRFNCDFLSPADSTTIHFSSADACNQNLLPKFQDKIAVDLEKNGTRYVEATDNVSNSAITWRFILNQEQCVYALGLYKNNLDNVLQGLWKN